MTSAAECVSLNAPALLSAPSDARATALTHSRTGAWEPTCSSLFAKHTSLLLFGDGYWLRDVFRESLLTRRRRPPTLAQRRSRARALALCWIARSARWRHTMHAESFVALFATAFRRSGTGAPGSPSDVATGRSRARVGRCASLGASCGSGPCGNVALWEAADESPRENTTRTRARSG
jgi:hypothetical protein